MKGSEKGDEKERDESENGVKRVGKGRRRQGGKGAMEKGRRGKGKAF